MQYSALLGCDRENKVEKDKYYYNIKYYII